MIKGSKSFYVGKEITDLNDLKNEKSIFWGHGFNNYTIINTSFIINWPLSLILKCKFYYAIKDTGLNF
jgi:hypothetical protein